MKARADIGVLGGGPAGSFAARALVRLGFDVVLWVGEKRQSLPEGIARRAADLLANAGCEEALKTLSGEVCRRAVWGGAETQANTEHIVDRPAFDMALLSDAANAGVHVVTGRATIKAPGDQPVIVGPGGEPLAVRFVLDARGRAAPAADCAGHRGPATLALARRWRFESLRKSTAVISLPKGWCWLVCDDAGEGMVQFLTATGPHDLKAADSATRHFADFADALLDAYPDAAGFGRGRLVARSATVRQLDIFPRTGVLRIGDATMTIDPLSGHGIFEALASAHAAVPAVNTFLNKPGNAEAARRFIAERVAERFWRSALIGRDFYRQENRWPQENFWRTRQSWPGDVKMEMPTHEGAPGFQRKSVVEDDVIRTAQVWVSEEYPRGIWKVSGVTLETLFRLLKRGASLEEACAQLKAPLGAVKEAKSWLESQTNSQFLS